MHAKKFLVVLVAASFIFQSFSFTAFAGGGDKNGRASYYSDNPSDLPSQSVPPDFINFQPSNYSFIADHTTTTTSQLNGQTYQTSVIVDGHVINSISGAVATYQSKQITKRYAYNGAYDYVYDGRAIGMEYALETLVMNVNGQSTIKMEIRFSQGVYELGTLVKPSSSTVRARGDEAKKIIDAINQVTPDNLVSWFQPLVDMANIWTTSVMKANANQSPLSYKVQNMVQYFDYKLPPGPIDPSKLPKNERSWYQNSQLLINGIQYRSVKYDYDQSVPAFTIKSIQNVLGYDVFYGAAYAPDGFTFKGFGIVFKKGSEEAVAEYPKVKEVWLNGGLYYVNVDSQGSVQLTAGVIPTGSN